MTNEIGVVGTATKTATNVLAQAKSVEVDSPETANGMTALIEFCDEQIEQLETARKSLTQPLNKQVRFINDQFRDARERFEEASREGRNRLKPWLDKLAREEREREEAERKAAEEAAKKAADKAAAKANGAKDPEEPKPNSPEDLGMAPPPPPPPEPPAPPVEKPQGRKKKASTRKVKKWRIVQMDKIPSKYFTLDHKLVDAAHKKNTPIPGIEYYEESEVVMR
jgi:predicted phage tail protein